MTATMPTVNSILQICFTAEVEGLCSWKGGLTPSSESHYKSLRVLGIRCFRSGGRNVLFSIYVHGYLSTTRYPGLTPLSGARPRSCPFSTAPFSMTGLQTRVLFPPHPFLTPLIPSWPGGRPLAPTPVSHLLSLQVDCHIPGPSEFEGLLLGRHLRGGFLNW